MLLQVKWAEVACKLCSFIGIPSFTSVDKKGMQKGEDIKCN